MPLIECPDCAGTGDDVKRRRYDAGGRLKSVTFDLTKKCGTCKGTGKALAKRNVLYVGRPDLSNTGANNGK